MADKAEIDSAALKRPSFAPKPRIRPKPKGGASTSAKTGPPPILNTSTELCAYSPENLKLDLEGSPPAAVSAVVATAMDVDETAPLEEEDVVVREIDVFFTPSSEEDETKLYVMQFPLRPRWRPYDLAEKCTEVRMMPKRAKMELDLSLDTGRNNFDRDFAESMGIDKQTLSSEVAPCATDYAVGVLKDNQIYLNPIYSVVQMRPVVKSEDQKRKRESLKDSSLPSSSKTMKKDPADSNQIEEEEEEWVPLEFHPENSDLSFEHGKSMVLDSLNIVDFKMSKSDYMGSLCPMNNFNKKEAFRKSIKHLPLDEQIKQWVTKKTVNTFEEIRVIFAPSTLSSEILTILQSYTFLIQGQWVTKSSLLYSPSEPTLQFESHARDFILLQLSKNKPIPFSTIEKHFGTRALEGDFKLKRMFDQLTVKREECRDLKFRFSPDLKFGKQFPRIVREQEEEWVKREKGVLDNLSKFGPRGVSKLVSNVTNASISGSTNNNDNNNNDSRNNMNKNKGVNGKSIAEPETRKNLLEALTIIFEEQKVRTVGSVVRDLREMAKRLSALPKETSKNRQIIEASLRGVNANVADLNEAIKQVAAHVGNNVFVRKPPNRDNLRNVFIRFCIDKKEFKKKEIMDFARTYFKREIKELEYTKVVEDICDVTEDGGLVLKSGD